MAAALATLAAGVAPAKIRKSLYAFAPVEHRLEPVAEKDGVLWINDSKATNVDSVYYALESMTRPVVWIAGGTDKGNDYEPLKAFAREKVHTLVCMGVDNRKLVESFTGVVPEVISTASLDEAMEAAVRRVRATPCCCRPPAPRSICSATTNSAASCSKNGSANTADPSDDESVRCGKTRRTALTTTEQ